MKISLILLSCVVGSFILVDSSDFVPTAEQREHLMQYLKNILPKDKYDQFVEIGQKLGRLYLKMNSEKAQNNENEWTEIYRQLLEVLAELTRFKNKYISTVSWEELFRLAEPREA